MIGSLSLSNQKNLTKKRFFLKDVVVAEFNNLDSFYSSLKSNKISGVIIEPIQANGGIIPAKRDFILAISQECKKREIPLIIDEVSTGLGRTGGWFAYNEYGNVEPDIICVGKHLGGGIFPTGACIISKKVKLQISSDALQYNTTFSNQMLANAIGNEVIRIINEENLLSIIRKNGDYLLERLKWLKERHPDKIVDVRGRGLICGVELSNFILNIKINLYSLAVIRSMFLKKKILLGMTSSNTSVIRLHPPFIISQGEIDEFISGFDDVLSINKIDLIKDMGFNNLKDLLRDENI
jgi:acetylornithine/succinyldiaminopimelate/putrescine aminotransferase